MTADNYESRRRLESLSPEELTRHQLGRLNQLLEKVLPHNRFYAEKLGSLVGPEGVESLEQFAQLPFTFKDELVSNRRSNHAANLTYPLERYVRFHRTSGTQGRPMVVLDTAEDWQWWISTWQYVLDAAELGPEDRVMMAFSFGPFIGFWSAFDAACHRGALVIPAGGMSTLARLELTRGQRATVLMCTPSYALHLADVAAENQIDTASLDVRRIIVAGEPGGSVPNIRRRIEEAWNASVVDHSGASEVGPWGYADEHRLGLHINEAEFLAEFLSIESGKPAGEGELSELVLTTLGRAGCPVFRYRTGDLVKPSWNVEGDNNFVLLEGGVLGRVDDMMVIRGVNIYPSSVEQILRSFPEVVEYRMTAHRDGHMDALKVEIEDRLESPERVAKELRLRLGLRVDVECVPIGTLPRFEAKGKRFIDQRR
ncbi:MAG: phenylacetate--CoA ligase family protein [Planctomycetales bacterium]|nr:phenylacetate--CoA ligase family protein [Planctomycetales bacterium]